MYPFHHHHTARMVLEAGYPNTKGFRKIVKATILVKKKAELSDAEFIEHYNHKHAVMATPVLLRHGCLSYSLVRFLVPFSDSCCCCCCSGVRRARSVPWGIYAEWGRRATDVSSPTRPNDNGRHAAQPSQSPPVRRHLHVCLQRLQGFCQVHVRTVHGVLLRFYFCFRVVGIVMLIEWGET